MEEFLPDRTRALRNIAITFVLLTVVLLGFVVYTALSRARIQVTLTPIQKDVSFQIPLQENVIGAAVPSGSVAATFFESTATMSDTFTVSTPTQLSEYAGGVVNIHNEANRDQPLVATTRFLGPSGELFRLVEAVRVPAGGEVKAVVKADSLGEQFLLGASRFTIPGLADTLQSQIYATSDVAMVLGGADEQVVTEQDIENARQTLLQRIRQQTKDELMSSVAEGDLAEQDYVTVVTQETVSEKPGAKARSFSVSLETRITAVAFKKEFLDALIITQAGGNVTIVPDSRKYEIESFDAVKRSATLTGQAQVEAGIDRGSSIFSPVNFVGATPKEIQEFLQNFEGVANVAVSVSPYWQRQLPRLPSRIHVEFR
ncbi:MAG: hypothetical protein WC052_02225 [Patescibacteria group bacterium]